ncbi:response regulator [Cohnella cholangitidis]|uniref:Response regulator n=1 Tax=Cohnella cholangitidis TaxID=2598458 RepID=A0A7G5C085_9BACL|nr:response regulator [Cohnella cholangitidis]QMV42619.1 response regulator [Cohnella cholangitidis]
MRVIIVEDEKPILDLMERLVGKHPLLTVVGAFTSAAAALEAYEELAPDAAFLDVEMPKMGGIELADKLKSKDERLQIVFTTAYPEYALEAFRVNAVDYVLKPVTPDAIERVAARLSKNYALTSVLRPVVEEGEPPVRCLGTFETRLPDGSLMNWPTRKTEELFAYLLAYPNRLAGKWHLADLLWPELDEERALHNVHNTVYRLKKALREAGFSVELAHAGEGYDLRTPPIFSDLERFRDFMKGTSLINERNAVTGKKLLASSRGALFGNKDYVWSAGLEAEVRLQMVSLTRMLTVYFLGIGDETSTKETLCAYLAYAPLDEEMNAELLRLYSKGGELGLFRSHYEKYARLLSEELGLGPSEQLREMAAGLSAI